MQSKWQTKLCLLIHTCVRDLNSVEIPNILFNGASHSAVNQPVSSAVTSVIRPPLFDKAETQAP